MPIYEYKCPQCGVSEKNFPMGCIPPTDACPTCGGEARHVISSPALRLTSTPMRTVLEHAEKSRHEPTVARRQEASGGAGSKPVSPALQRLVGKEAAGRLRVAQHPASPSARHAHPHLHPPGSRSHH